MTAACLGRSVTSGVTGRNRRRQSPILRGDGAQTPTSSMATGLGLADVAAYVLGDDRVRADGEPEQHEAVGEPFFAGGEKEVHHGHCFASHTRKVGGSVGTGGGSRIGSAG